ncbi:ATPase, T2SS/T4P/T4SS family [Wukongibacter baidiensis]|uniref:ATPase, T2SS/T4P/T4SS family n=1 Tax=Wukongibacter baidiensis TaxID=1723361 RepID=UPI003D7F1E5A
MDISQKIIKLYEMIEDITDNIDRYSELLKISKDKAEKDIEYFKALRKKSRGNRQARIYVINTYVRFMVSVLNFDKEIIKEYIDFNNLQSNDISILFEMVLDVFDISELIDKYTLDVKITEKDIREIAKKEEKHLYEHFNKPIDQVRFLATLIYASEDGQSVIDSLQYQNINEIGFSRKDYIYIEYRKNKYYLSFLRFKDNETALNIQSKNTVNTKPHYDQNHPIVVSNKDNSNRITVAGYISTPTDEHLYYNERIFNLENIFLETMRDELRTIDDLVYELIMIHLEGKGKHLVTGADAGVGKSTFLNSMILKIPDKWGILVLDSSYELQSDKKAPDKNIYFLIENPLLSVRQNFEYGLKMARDIINYGEIVKAGQMAELINAGLRLNSGIGATLHSFSPFEVIQNCRNLMMRSDMYDDSGVAEGDVARCVDIIFHLGKHPKDKGRIILQNVVEVIYIDQDTYVEPMLTGKRKDMIFNLLKMSQLALHKYLYRKNYKYNEIIRYDERKDAWIPINLPSSEYFNRISNYVSREKIDKWINRFMEKVG